MSPIPDIQLREDADQPIYRQIAQAIDRAIADGELAEGARLPAIRTLAAELKVNRDTVALAYDALVGQGRVESTVGRGTFVLSRQRGEGRGAEGPTLSPHVQRLLAIENTRARFGDVDPVVAMHSLIPDPELYPVDEFRRAFNRAMAKGGADLLLYGSAQGYLGLREVIAERFCAAGYEVDAASIVLCHGASQGIALALQLFASGGDRIAVESPTYHNVLATLAGLGMEPVLIPMRDDGPDLAVLERVLSEPDVKGFYTIPTFHNPMGVTSTVANRRQLLEIARRTGKPIVEDAFEMDLRCSGQPLPPLAALDQDDLVVHLYSYSKSLFPGLRIGSITTRGRAIDGLIALKHAMDLSDSMPLQAALAEFIRDGAYERHLGRIRRTLRRRHTAVAEALAEHLPEGTTWTRPEGGYQVWVELPIAVDTRDLLADAAREGVLFSPGSQFQPGGGPSRGLRLTLAQANEQQIEHGVAVLGRLIRARASGQTEAHTAAAQHL